MVGLLSPRCPEPRQEPARDVPAGKSLQVDPAGGPGPPLGELWLAQDPGVAQSSLSCPWNEGSSVIHDMPHPTPQGPWGHSCWPAPGQLTGEPLSSCLRRTLGVLGSSGGPQGQGSASATSGGWQAARPPPTRFSVTPQPAVTALPGVWTGGVARYTASDPSVPLSSCAAASGGPLHLAAKTLFMNF